MYSYEDINIDVDINMDRNADINLGENCPVSEKPEIPNQKKKKKSEPCGRKDTGDEGDLAHRSLSFSKSYCHSS